MWDLQTLSPDLSSVSLDLLGERHSTPHSRRFLLEPQLSNGLQPLLRSFYFETTKSQRREQLPFSFFLGTSYV